MNLAGKTAIVTGAAAGLGRLTAVRLAEHGASVAAFDRDGAGLEDLAAELPHATAHTCDVCDPVQTQAAVDAVFEASGAIDILVNNAGLIRSAPLLNLLAKGDRQHSVALWNEVIAANLTSVFLVTAKVVEKMAARRTKGAIVNVSSISAAGNAGQSAYSAAKAGVNALTVTWAKELGPLGIRVNTVAPGFIDTESTRRSLKNSTLTELERETPLRRLGRAEDVVDAICACLTNGYLNGAAIPVDGGLRL